MIELINLDEKITNKMLAEKLNEIIEALNTQSQKEPKGPKSERAMSEEDAKRILHGDLKELSHKDAADTLGLSYGQVYSARKGFTFKHIN